MEAVKVVEAEEVVEAAEVVERLPTEILFRIFAFVPGHSLWSCLGVSSRWRQVANTDRLWRPHCLRLAINHPEVPNLLDASPLCGWATAFFSFYCRPVGNWRSHLSTPMELFLKSPEFLQFWVSQYCLMYYYMKNKVYLYQVTRNEIETLDILNVEILNLANRNYYPSLGGDLKKYIGVSNYNVILIYEKFCGIFRLAVVLSLNDDNVLEITDEPLELEGAVYCGFSKERQVQIKVILGESLWLYEPSQRIFYTIHLSSRTLRHVLNYRTLTTRPEVPLLVALHGGIIEVYNSDSEVILKMEDHISFLCFNAHTIVVNKFFFSGGLSSSEGGPFSRSVCKLKEWNITKRSLSSRDMITGRELAQINIRAVDMVLHPVDSRLIALQSSGTHYAIICVDAREGTIFWEIRRGGVDSWFPEINIVMFDFVFVWPSYNDNDKYTLIDVRTGRLIEETRKPSGDTACITGPVWVLENSEKYLTIQNYL